MRIGIDATCLPSALAGAGRYIHGVVRGLASVDGHNEYFIFIKAQHAGKFERLPANMQLVPLPNFSRPLRLAWQHFAAGQHARQLKLEVWHGMHYTLPAFTRSLATVATFHDLGVILYPHFYAWGKRVYFRQAITRALHTARHLVAVSEATGGDLKRLLAQRKNGSAQPPVAVIPSGVDEKFFTSLSAEQIARVLQAHHLDAPYLLFVGTFEKRKNLNLLVRALHILGQRGHDNCMLALAGQPDNGSAEVRATIAQLGLQQRVRILGYVPEEDLPALYQGAALFALPSYYEGFGFPLLEAMAGGVAALAADNSSLRELAAHPALLCEETPAAWAHKMEHLLCDQKLRRELSAYARARARAFSWRRTAEQLCEIYESHARRTPYHAKTGGTSAASPNSEFRATLVAGGASAELLHAVRRTLAYADLFDYPLTCSEIHYGLFGVQAVYAEVRQALRGLEDGGEIMKAEGHYFLAGRAPIVALRQQRREWSQALLQKNRRWLRLVRSFPFVRCAALSGAMAFQNCTRSDDIDLFLIVEKGRLWTVYTGLAILLKLAGKRRRLCLNCLVDTEHLLCADQDDFVAHQIAFLQPESGAESFRQFVRANGWCGRHLPQSNMESRLTEEIQTRDLSLARARWRVALEGFLRRPLFDRLEDFICEHYRRRIAHLTQHLPPQAVAATPGQIKLFTNNHRFRVQRSVAARLQELEKPHLLDKQNVHDGFAAV